MGLCSQVQKEEKPNQQYEIRFRDTPFALVKPDEVQEKLEL